MAFLVDSNILVYGHDARYPEKQEAARRLLREGIRTGEARVAHQAIVEFVAATTRPAPRGRAPILSREEALVQAERLLTEFDVLYPVEAVVRLALRGAATYGLPWFDAHMWAYAEHYGLPVLYSEDFQHDRLYGTVRTVNPFARRD